MRIKEQDRKQMKEFGAHLRAFREQAELGLSEVAREAGLTPSFLSQVERGVYKGASVRSLELLFKALRYPSKPAFFAKAGMVEPDVAAVVMKHPDEFAFIVFALKSLGKAELRCFGDQMKRYVADAKQRANEQACNRGAS